MKRPPPDHTICPQCDGHGHFDRALYGRVTCETCWGTGVVPLISYNEPHWSFFQNHTETEHFRDES